MASNVWRREEYKNISAHCREDKQIHKPWFINLGGTPPIVISSDMFYGTLPINQPFGFINPGLTL